MELDDFFDAGELEGQHIIIDGPAVEREYMFEDVCILAEMIEVDEEDEESPWLVRIRHKRDWSNIWLDPAHFLSLAQNED